MSGAGATASQAWAILKRHARDEISSLRLQELCKDNDRVSSLVEVHNSEDNHMLMVDLSRQRITLETLNHLLRLATSREVKGFITRLAWGPNDPENPVVPAHLKEKIERETITTRFETNETSSKKSSRRRVVSPERHSPIPSFHVSLRALKGLKMYKADGTNALKKIHSQWERIQRASQNWRRGQVPGATGSMIRDVVVIGRGVPIMALRFVYLALCKDRAANIGRRSGLKGQRRIKFLTSIDPIRAAALIADLDPASTLVITIALNGNEENLMATSTLKNWLLKSLGNGRRPEAVINKHMFWVTGSERLASQQKSENVFMIPEHSRCEAFTAFSAAALLVSVYRDDVTTMIKLLLRFRSYLTNNSLLILVLRQPLSIVFGWPIVEKFLAGAHDMDVHFVESNPRHNLPVLLALIDIWNDSFLSSNGRILIPSTEAFAAYPAFCASLEAQTCGNASHSKVCSSLVVDGGLHSMYDRALYQTGRPLPTELVVTMDSQIISNVAGLHGVDDIPITQDALMCSIFGHADELAFGGSLEEGNRPSTLLLCGICDAFACGQLVAMAEHRAIVKARIWDIDPFCSEIGSSIRAKRTEQLRDVLQTMYTTEEEEEDNETGEGINLSTKTILRHYANMTRDQRS